jgi:hypothetical protein
LCVVRSGRLESGLDRGLLKRVNVKFKARLLETRVVSICLEPFIDDIEPFRFDSLDVERRFVQVKSFVAEHSFLMVAACVVCYLVRVLYAKFLKGLREMIERQFMD